MAGANVTIPMEMVDEVSNRFANTFYGYFIGKRLAFPIVENYVKNLEKVLEEGSLLIRLVPIFLNSWTPNSKLTKEEITSAPVWVKIHNVPLVAYFKVSLSLITTQLGRPIMLDAYTSAMCLKSWG